MTGFLRGSATAMITPFNENGVDLEAFGETSISKRSAR